MTSRDHNSIFEKNWQKNRYIVNVLCSVGHGKIHLSSLAGYIWNVFLLVIPLAYVPTYPLIHSANVFCTYSRLILHCISTVSDTYDTMSIQIYTITILRSMFLFGVVMSWLGYSPLGEKYSVHQSGYNFIILSENLKKNPSLKCSQSKRLCTKVRIF